MFIPKRSPASKKSTPLQSSRTVLLPLILILSTSLPAECISLSQLGTLISLSNSLMNRVANLRAARGDYSGSERARRIADKLEGGGLLRLSRGMWSMGWDYKKNYAWRDVGSSSMEMFRAISDMKELQGALSELSRLKSDKERAAWVVRNYKKLLGISNSVLWKLLQVFRQSGQLRDMVLILQQEVEGNLLTDCLELGANDLKGLIQIVKDITPKYFKILKHFGVMIPSGEIPEKAVQPLNKVSIAKSLASSSGTKDHASSRRKEVVHMIDQSQMDLLNYKLDRLHHYDVENLPLFDDWRASKGMPPTPHFMSFEDYMAIKVAEAQGDGTEGGGVGGSTKDMASQFSTSNSGNGDL